MATRRKIRVHGGRCLALSLSRFGKSVFRPQRSLRLRGAHVSMVRNCFGPCGPLREVILSDPRPSSWRYVDM